MVPFQSAFLGKRSSKNGVKNDGARRLERRLRTYRQSRSRARSVAAAGTTASSGSSCRSRVMEQELGSHALHVCSHSDINTGSSRNGTAASSLEPLALEQPHVAKTLASGSLEHTASEGSDGRALTEIETPNHPGRQQIDDTRAERGTHVIEDSGALAASDADFLVHSSAGGRRWGLSSDLVEFTQSEVTERLTKRGHQLCARMNALAATLNSQPIRQTASRSHSVPPLGSGTSDSILGTGNATALTRSGATTNLAPLRMPHAQRRALPEGTTRDRRPRRATVPVTSDRPGGSVRLSDGHRHRDQLAPLETKSAVKGHRLVAQSLIRNSDPSGSQHSTIDMDKNVRNRNGNALAPPLFERRGW